MPTTTGFEFGDIVLVRFPFTDQLGSKQRPAVVVSSTAYHRQRPDLILMAVTSQVQRAAGFGDTPLQDWQAAGLLKPSAIKPVLFTAEHTLIRKTLGPLSARDQTALQQTLAVILGH